MKKIKYILSLFVSASLLFGLNRCSKTVENPVFEPYAETNLDATGGNWKTYVLANGSDIAVPAPEDATSAAYLAELADLKSKMSAATAGQQDLARLWGANGVLRWHEIARELAAQYNVPPDYKDDGTYPAPDPLNPTVYPRFPFANPPYASRAFALLAVAQYDALVTAWHAKFQYSRLAPYKNDASIQPLIPVNDLPSYPSEDAVVAAASREVLKFLFPGEKPLLDEKSTEHKNSRLWAGANVQSDLDAGDSLGRMVALRVIAYAKTDKMGAANNQVAYPNLKADATARGITVQWTSRDIPARPPMLPFFGEVKTWNLDRPTLISVRPAAPPAIGTPDFETALNELRDMVKNRTREQFRITTYWADGVGTYTPPGHWDRRAAELIYEKQFNELRSARAMALVNTALQDAGVACWDTKYFYLLPRPTEVDPDVTTATGIPNFPAYTSGHSTFSAAGAEVLSYLFPDHATDLLAMAKEASNSRIYGCIHYRFDCEIGLEHGKKIGDFAIQRGQNDGSQ
ncbi:MAG: phosphatase PAP2 family protein [Saprospiraceae bacterium]|nr:phosphatase PAP2 family protein [Saprospiraceae bacterium]